MAFVTNWQEPDSLEEKDFESGEAQLGLLPCPCSLLQGWLDTSCAGDAQDRS